MSSPSLELNNSGIWSEHKRPSEPRLAPEFALQNRAANPSRFANILESELWLHFFVLESQASGWPVSFLCYKHGFDKVDHRWMDGWMASICIYYSCISRLFSMQAVQVCSHSRCGLLFSERPISAHQCWQVRCSRILKNLEKKRQFLWATFSLILDSSNTLLIEASTFLIDKTNSISEGTGYFKNIAIIYICISQWFWNLPDPANTQYICTGCSEKIVFIPIRGNSSLESLKVLNAFTNDQ